MVSGYIFGTPSSFVIVVLAPDGALGRNSLVLCLDMGIEGRVGQVAQVAAPACELSALFIISSLPGFLLFGL